MLESIKAHERGGILGPGGHHSRRYANCRHGQPLESRLRYKEFQIGLYCTILYVWKKHTFSTVQKHMQPNLFIPLASGTHPCNIASVEEARLGATKILAFLYINV
jgi:hypothetical protein